MMVIDNALEERWFNSKNQSVSEMAAFIKKSPAILKKYKFDKIQSEIIYKLLKSNDRFWSDIDEATKNGRKRRKVMYHIAENVLRLTKEIMLEQTVESPDEQKLQMLSDELMYIKENFDPKTNTLIVYDELNRDYSDVDLIFFFIEYAEKIDTLIEHTMNEEDSFSKDVLFAEYFTKLFAFSLNGIGIEFEDNVIKLKTVVDDEDIAAVEELNNDNNNN